MKGDPMSKQTREFFEQLKAGQQPSLTATLKEIGGKLWDAATPMVEHGGHEMASLLFRGDAFVMYPRTGNGGQSHEGQGLQQEAAKEEPQRQQERDRDGPEL
jgi:hypothetical protein